MSIARSFLGGSESPAESAEEPAAEAALNFEAGLPPSPSFSPSSSSPLDSLLNPSLLSNLDPKIMSLAVNVLGEYSADDDKIKLLHAIKPHLSDVRGGRVEKAVQIFRISKTLKTVMKSLGGGGDV